MVLIANEASDSRINNGLNGLLCKLDIEKSYDHVKWNYLQEILDKLGLVKNGSIGSNRASL